MKGKPGVMAYVTYLLRCVDGTLYAGYTKDLDARLAAHNAGKGASYTRGRRPVTLVYREEFESQAEAMRRELELKRWSRPRKEALIAAARQAGG